MNNKIIIGLCGKKFSGKSTFGHYVKDKYNFKIYSFGDSLKKSLKDIFFFTDEELNGNKKEVINDYWEITPREIMQFYGTELMREQLGNKYNHIGNKIWIKSLEYKLLNDIKNDNINKIIIDDVRFNNEINWIKNFGKKYNYTTYIINISSPNDNIIQNNFTQHKSENENLYYSMSITNTKTILKDFYDNIDNMFKILNII